MHHVLHENTSTTRFSGKFQSIFLFLTDGTVISDRWHWELATPHTIWPMWTHTTIKIGVKSKSIRPLSKIETRHNAKYIYCFTDTPSINSNVFLYIRYKTNWNIKAYRPFSTKETKYKIDVYSGHLNLDLSLDVSWNAYVSFTFQICSWNLHLCL